MRIIDLHCYPNTEPWIKSQGPYVEAPGKYWNRSWTAKTEAEVIGEFKNAGVEPVLVAFDIETVTGTPPCSNEYVAKVRGDNPGVILQAWAAVDPFKGEAAIEEAKRAIRKLSMLGFHFHPIMGHFSVDERRFYPLWEVINELRVPVMIDVGTTGMGAGMPGGLGAIIRHAHPAASGILVAAIDVRWAKEAPYPASVADASYGIRWLKLKAREWNGDPEAVGALGSSRAGAT